MTTDLAAIVAEMREAVANEGGYHPAPGKWIGDGIDSAAVEEWANQIESALHSPAPEREGWVENAAFMFANQAEAIAELKADRLRLDFIESHRVSLTPEYEGQWDAELYDDAEQPKASCAGAGVRAAIDNMMNAVTSCCEAAAPTGGSET